MLCRRKVLWFVMKPAWVSDDIIFISTELNLYDCFMKRTALIFCSLGVKVGLKTQAQPLLMLAAKMPRKRWQNLPKPILQPRPLQQLQSPLPLTQKKTASTACGWLWQVLVSFCWLDSCTESVKSPTVFITTRKWIFEKKVYAESLLKNLGKSASLCSSNTIVNGLSVSFYGVCFMHAILVVI